MKKALHEKTRDELDTLYEQVKAEDAAMFVELFGESDAARYRRLQRTANSYLDVNRADAAYAEIELLEARLTDAERNRLFGIGEPDV